MKIVTVIGARPQIIKAAALSRAIRSFKEQVKEVIVHTGQHYDPEMSDVFIRELEIPEPDYNLGVGSGAHGMQTATMISGIEQVLVQEKPDWLVVYGDTNSTLAAAVAASKIHVPVAHIEAGLRSFNKSMPEEINRIVCDHVSTLLFSPTYTGYQNLLREGFRESQPPYTIDRPGLFHCGDLMYDNSLYYSRHAASKTSISEKLQLQKKPFFLVTIHRNNNTDDPERLNIIFRTLLEISEKSGIRMILPLHPRTKKMMESGLDQALLERMSDQTLVIIPPASFLEMIVLEQHAKMVFTDSGGVQKESYFFEKPCIILRPETEWVELVENGTARICDADPEKILAAYTYFSKEQNLKFPSVFGDGNAAGFILEQLYTHTPNKSNH
jgi:UDP-GlcNAc3NAcA epimerase